MTESEAATLHQLNTGRRRKSGLRKSFMEGKLGGRLKFFNCCTVPERLAHVMSIFANFFGMVDFSN